MKLYGFLSLMLAAIFHLSCGLRETCRYAIYPNAIIPKFISKKNTTILLEDLDDAKDICNSMGDECSGVVSATKLMNRIYALASGSNLVYTTKTITWRRQCTGDCSYRLATGVDRTRKYYRRVCHTYRSRPNNWMQWSAWSKCSPPCGSVGQQSRFRQCLPSLRGATCSGNRYQKRNCNYAKKCPRTLSDVYAGIEGPQGFNVAGNTPIYRSCIMVQPKDRKPCGTQEFITREQCQRFGCCYDPYANGSDVTTSADHKQACFRATNYLTTGLIGWTTWSPWTICSKSCRNGTRIRSRVCTGGLTGSLLCPGPDSLVESCTLGTCPCDVNPCKNGGSCTPDGNLARGYRCSCNQNFVGRHCDFSRPSLSCGNDSITIAFDRRIIPDEGLVDDVKLIHFQGYESSLCYAQISQDKTQYVLSIPPPIDRSCGSTINVTGEEYAIRNKVMWRQTHGVTSSTVILLDLKCVYNKQLNMTTGLGFGINPITRTLASRTGFSTFTVDMTLYRDKDFLPSQLLTGPTRIAEGEILYVSVDMVAISIVDQQNEVIVLDHCYATDTTDKRTPIYDFILDRCSTNPAFTTILENGVSTSGRWGFRVFEWALQSETDDIFIMCKAHVCDTGFEECVPSCRDGSTTTSPPDGSTEGLTEGQTSMFEELLQSLTLGNSTAPSSGSRRKRSVAIMKKDNRRLKNDQDQDEDTTSHDSYHVTVSKRITVVTPRASYPSERLRGKGRLFSADVTSQRKFGDGVTSIFVLASGSLIVYVTISLLMRQQTRAA